MKTVRIIIIPIICALLFLLGWWLGKNNKESIVDETIRIDTVFYGKPMPFSISDDLISVNVPKWLFAPPKIVKIYDEADSIIVPNNGAIDIDSVTNNDSIKMQVIIRTIEYKDSTYYARVVGPVIGSLSPRLDYFETYNTTITRTVKSRSKFIFSAGAGTEYSRIGWTPFAEIDFAVDLRFATISATFGADNIFKSPAPRIGIKASVPIWSK